jgi:hypothetical protein
MLVARTDYRSIDLSDDDPKPSSTTPDEGATSAEPVDGGTSQKQTSRRNFVRLAVSDAMGTAGQLAGLSGVVAATAAEAGRAMRESLEGLTDEGDRPRPSASSPARATVGAHPATGDGASPNLTRDTLPTQAMPVLAGVHRGVLATVVGDGSPFVTVGPVRYDGAAFITTGRESTVKVANVQRDPRVSIAVSDESGGSLLVNGLARIESGDEAAKAARAIHLDTGSVLPDEFGVPDDRGSLVLIVIEPLRAFWRSADALP